MTGRAMEPLTIEHLRHLGRLADEDRQRMFARNPHLEVHRDRLLCVVLCQGGACHYINGKTGVKDLDVWSFYSPGVEHAQIGGDWYDVLRIDDGTVWPTAFALTKLTPADETRIGALVKQAAS